MPARFLGFCAKFSNGVFLSTSFQTLAVLELTRFSVPGDLSISTVCIFRRRTNPKEFGYPKLHLLF